MRIYLYVVLFAFCSVGFSQKLLFHKKSYREAFYKVGDVLSFRIKGSRAKITRKIVGFEDSVIVFQDMKINPERISSIYVDDKTKGWYIFRYKYKRILPAAGIGWLLIDLINSGGVHPQTWVLSGSLVGAGLLARLFISERMKIKGRRKLLIID